MAALIGVMNALVFLGFEWVVHHGTDYIWNDLADSDEVRWRVLPLAILLSLVFSLLVRATRQPRMAPPHVDPLAAEEDAQPATLDGIAVILVIGAASLLAGASLGPEASLVAVSTGLGTWLAARAGQTDAARLLVLSSVGALMVAFLGSLVAALIPLLLLFREKRLTLATALPPIAAGLAAYATLYAIQGEAEGWGSIPAAEDLHLDDFFTAFVLGAIGMGVAVLLKWALGHSGNAAERIDRTWAWPLSAALFGAVLGGLYLAGGESVQFSGSEGIGILLREQADDGALVFAGLIAVKLAVTVWSLAIGYRGGLIFPTVYAGVAMTLLVGTVAEGLAGPGAMIGAISGILAAMTNPVVALVMVVALLPAELTGLAVFGVLGAVIAQRESARLIARGQPGRSRN
jgi:H+/Cl- antiporter ClcA